MTSIPDHYQALGIDPTADPEVITAAYRALAKKFHPDTGAATGTASPERFDEIQQAYEVLRTPESRHAYDLELLAATEAALQEHLAAKRRVVVAEPAAAAEPERPATPPPDIGDIRPEPAMPPRGTSGMPPRGRPRAASGGRRSMAAFAIPLLLMFAVGGGAAWLYLPVGPAAPPQPSATQATPATETPPASPPAAKPAVKADATPAPAPAAAPATAPVADDGPPVFGSTGSEADPPEVEEAAATPTDGAVPGAAASASNSAAKSDRPSFGSSLAADDAAAAPDAPAAAATAAADTVAAAAPPPVPKARPAQPSRPAAQPKPAQKTQQQAQAQPKAKLTYQNPPRYNPQPDGYPPPGYPPPGFEPPGYDPGYDQGYDPRAQYDPPPGFEGDYPPPGYPQGGLPGLGPYRLVIFERQPGRQATAWSAGVVFKSIGKCTRQGVKAVLRRTGGMDPEGTRVWYECQQLSQR